MSNYEKRQKSPKENELAIKSVGSLVAKFAISSVVGRDFLLTV